MTAADNEVPNTWEAARAAGFRTPAEWANALSGTDGRKAMPRYRYDTLVPASGAGEGAGVHDWHPNLPLKATEELWRAWRTPASRRRRLTTTRVLDNAGRTFDSAPRCLDSDPAAEAWIYCHDPRLWPFDQRGHDARKDAEQLIPTTCIACLNYRPADLWWLTGSLLTDLVGYVGTGGHSGPLGWVNVAGVICSECGDGVPFAPNARVRRGDRHFIDPAPATPPPDLGEVA